MPSGLATAIAHVMYIIKSLDAINPLNDLITQVGRALSK